METEGLATGVPEGTAGQARLCCPVEHRVEFLLVAAGVPLPGLGQGLDGGSVGVDIPTPAVSFTCQALRVTCSRKLEALTLCLNFFQMSEFSRKLKFCHQILILKE